MKPLLDSLTGVAGERAGERFERCRDTDCGVFEANPERWPIDVASLEALLEERVLRAPSDVRVMRDGRALDVAVFADPPRVSHPSLGAGLETIVRSAAVLALFDDGATVVFQGLQNHLRSLGACCAILAGELGAHVGANAYLSPPGSRGARHFDHHDVFMLQLAGEKHWTVHRPDGALGADGGDTAEPGYEPALRHDLRVGEAVYLPRGFWHECRTGDEASLHLTLSLQAPTCADLVRAAIERFLREPAYGRTAWRGEGPSPCAVALPERAVIDLDTHLRRVLAAGPEQPRGAAWAKGYANLGHRLAPFAMGTSSKLVPIDSGDWHEERDGETLHVRVGALRVTLPAAMAPSVSALRAGDPVSVGRLLDDQPEPVLFALSRELLRAGLVRLESDA